MRITTVRRGFVAEVLGHEERLIAQRDGRLIADALLTHSVLVLRGLRLDPAEQVALTRTLGEPEVVTDLRNHHPESKDILVVSNSGTTPVVGNQCWHSDRSFLPEPTRYTILRAHIVPPEGGDTLFADLVAAYAEMSAKWKAVLEGANGVHTYDKTAQLRAQIHGGPVEEDYELKYPPVRHPMVRAHPETGAPTLYLSELCLTRVESPDGHEAGVPVDDLHAHATADRFVHRHQWRQGDVLIWDNIRVLHRAATLPPDMPRVLHRTTTRGGITR